MTAACVIDASVAIKWVITEEGTEAANRLRWSGTAFHAPALIVPEAGNILWKKIRRDELTKAEAELACGLLRLANIQTHATGPQALLALQMPAELEHSVYDKTTWPLPGLDMPMVTADRRPVNKLAALGNSAFPEIVLVSRLPDTGSSIPYDQACLRWTSWDGYAPKADVRARWSPPKSGHWLGLRSPEYAGIDRPHAA